MVAIFNSACGNGGSVDDELYKNKMIKNLSTASIWLIEEGVHTFSKSGKTEFIVSLLTNGEFKYG